MSLSLAFRLTPVLLWVLPGLGAAQSLEQRVTRLEQILAGQSLSELVLEVNRLRQEIRELRGELEVQQHQIEGLRAAPRAGAVPSARAEATKAIPPLPVAPSTASGGTPETPRMEPPPAATPALTVPPAGESARPGSMPASGEEQAYRQAFEQLQQGRYEQALKDFQAFLERFPSGVYADSARYWLGEANYVQKDYPRALEAFERVLADYPQSPKVPGALLKIGYIYEAQREPAKARDTLERLVSEYGGTTEARLAQNRLDKLPK